MNTVQQEITRLEERLRQAELGPDAAVFEELLAAERAPSAKSSKRIDPAKPRSSPRSR